jgi:uncharacterized protein
VKSLRLSADLLLPLEAVTEKLGFLGRTGGGKSYAAQKLAEEMHAAGAQFVALDPVGIWWGLRLAKNGKDAGIAIPVLGGLRGDVPLEPSAGKVIADLVVDKGTSVVIDVSQFESDADKTRFATDFAARFFFRKKASPSPVHVFIEEAQEFVPQNTMKGEERMLHAFHRMIKLGRNFGIGASLISQRPQEVNKKVLNQTELLFVFQLTGPQERKVVEGWIREKGIDEDIAGELPKLKRGHPHAWSPAWLQISRVVAIGEKWTFDASSTPKVGAGQNVRELAPIDIEKLGAEIKKSAERAKAEDPKELRRQLAERDRQIRQLQSGKAVVQTVQKPVVDQAAIDRAVNSAVDKVHSLMRREAGNVRRMAARVNKIAHESIELLDSAIATLDIEFLNTNNAKPGALLAPKEHGRNPASSVVSQSGNRPEHRSAGHAGGGGRERPATNPSSLAKGEKAVLIAIAQYPDGAARDQLTVLTGYKRSSRDTYIQRLSAAGYIDASNGLIQATDAGVEALGSDYEPLPQGEQLQAYWIDRLPEGERRVLEMLLDAYPSPVRRDDLDSLTGYKRSSRDTYIQRLSSRRLVENMGAGQVRASKGLF